MVTPALPKISIALRLSSFLLRHNYSTKNVTRISANLGQSRLGGIAQKLKEGGSTDNQNR